MIEQTPQSIGHLILESLSCVSIILFILLLFCNFVLLLLNETVVIKYLWNIYVLIFVLILYIFSPKITTHITYKDNYLYSFVIYSIILSGAFCVINRYFPDLIYSYLYDFTIYCMGLLKIDEDFVVYIKYYNVLNTLDIEDTRELIVFLKNYTGDKYDNSHFDYSEKSIFAVRISIQDNYIYNDCNTILILSMHCFVLYIVVNNIFHAGHYLFIGFILLILMFINLVVYTGKYAVFMNKLRHLLLIIGFTIYVVNQMYLLQVFLVILGGFGVVYVVYVLERKYSFYATSNISFICKFFYGKYLYFLVSYITLVCSLLIYYMEYMSNYKVVLLKDNANVTTVF